MYLNFQQFLIAGSPREIIIGCINWCTDNFIGTNCITLFILHYNIAALLPIYQIDSLEKVQRRAVSFITGNYNREDSVTAMRPNIGLPTLQERRQQSRLAMMFKILHNQIAIPLPDYVTQKTRQTRSHHHLRLTRLSTSTNRLLQIQLPSSYHERLG